MKNIEEEYEKQHRRDGYFNDNIDQCTMVRGIVMKDMFLGYISPVQPFDPTPTPRQKEYERNAAELNFDFTSITNGINRAQLTLQELQQLAERQRQQILYNSKELLEKQQQLMRMHQDFRSKLKPTTTGQQQQQQQQQAESASTAHANSNSSKQDAISSPSSDAERERYAHMMRQTYQAHVGKLQSRPAGVSPPVLRQTQAEMQKLPNTELARELERVRGVFSQKQSELAEMVNKVDSHPNHFESRNGDDRRIQTDSTPDRLHRRRNKMLAAREELDRMRSELMVRSETSTQQSHQIQLQRDIIQDKKRELRQLNSRMNRIHTALRQQPPPPQQSAHYPQQSSHKQPTESRIPPSYSIINGSLDSDDIAAGPLLKNAYSISNTAVRKPHGRAPQNNSNVHLSNGHSSGFPDPRFEPAEPRRKPTPPLRVNTIPPAVAMPSQSYLTSLAAGNMSPIPSPSSSVSSLSSLSSSVTTPDEFMTSPPGAPPPPPPPRVAASGYLMPTRVDPPSADYVENLRRHKRDRTAITNGKLHEEQTTQFYGAPAEYEDAAISNSSDELRHSYRQYFDADSSSLADSLSDCSVDGSVDIQTSSTNANVRTESVSKPKPPVAPKPSAFASVTSSSSNISSSPSTSSDAYRLPENDFYLNDRNSASLDLSEQAISREEISVKINNNSGNDDNNNNNNDDDEICMTYHVFREQTTTHSRTNDPVKPSTQAHENVSTTVSNAGSNKLFESPPEEFELSFTDIDDIQLVETDGLFPWQSLEVTSQSDESSAESNDGPPVMPVVISAQPEKMPPSILKRPDRESSHPGRRIRIDPFTLLLDSSLEGELDEVKEQLMKIADISRANAEGITALHNAVCGNHEVVVRYLVEAGCDVNAADNNGWTPLHCSAFYNDLSLCKYLVEHGANTHAQTHADMQTPAHKCSQLDENYEQCFEYLDGCKQNVGRTDGGQVFALYDYDAEKADELSFLSGDQLAVVRRGDPDESEWWWAHDRNGNQGYIPFILVGNFSRLAAEV